MLQYLISVVIPTYQRRPSVERVLAALAQQTLPSEAYQVVVAIDGSDDGTGELVDRFPAPYALQALWQPNRGRAAACNAGIRAAQGELVVLLDDDMEPTPECLTAHLNAHAGGARLGVLGAVPIRVTPQSPPVVAYIANKFNRHLDRLAQPGYKLHLRDFYTGHFSIRRQTLLEVGGFDEAFKVYGNEDLELSLRLSGAGVEFVYRSDVVAWQHYTKTFAALARDHIAKGQTAVLLAHKHPATLPDLKLSAYQGASPTWRTLRAGLLALSRAWSGTPDTVAATVGWLEQRRWAHGSLLYDRALDYYYWLGARQAQRAWSRDMARAAITADTARGARA